MCDLYVFRLCWPLQHTWQRVPWTIVLSKGASILSESPTIAMDPERLSRVCGSCLFSARTARKERDVVKVQAGIGFPVSLGPRCGFLAQQVPSLKEAQANGPIGRKSPKLGVQARAAGNNQHPLCPLRQGRGVSQKGHSPAANLY